MLIYSAAKLLHMSNTRTITGIVGPLTRDFNEMKVVFSTSKNKKRIVTLSYNDNEIVNPLYRTIGIVETDEEENCLVCFTDAILYLCPESRNCQAKYCKNCIDQYAEYSDSCKCYSCGYTFTLGDMVMMYGSKIELIKSKLYRRKLRTYTVLYDKYMNYEIRRVNAAKKFCEITSLSLDSKIVVTLLSGDDEYLRKRYRPDISALYQDIWLDVMDNIQEGNVVDRCRDCDGNIEEITHDRMDCTPYTTYDCLQCTNRLCKYCGIVYCRDKQVHRCTRNDVLSYREILKTSKQCPSCYTRVTKIIGCDVMWCTECGTTFDWETGKVMNESNHNPEHHDYLTTLYDGINLRDSWDFDTPVNWNIARDKMEEYILRERLRHTYTATQLLEKIVLCNLPLHIYDVLHKLSDLDRSLQKDTIIKPTRFRKERMEYLLSDKSESDLKQYNDLMQSHAIGMFRRRYICTVIQRLRTRLLHEIKGFFRVDEDLPREAMHSVEVLYIRYCKIISIYSKEIESIGDHLYESGNLYYMLYGKANEHTYSYYDKYTGIIIPAKYSIGHNLSEQMSKTLISILRSRLYN